MTKINTKQGENMKVIFPKNKSGETVKEFIPRSDVNSTFQIDGTLDGVEEITFNLLGINGTDIAPWVDEYGDAIKFTATRVIPIPVYSSLDLQIIMPETVNNVGLKLVG